MNLKRVFIFATLFMCVASIAFAQANLQNGVLQMAVANAANPLSAPLGTLDTTNNAGIINSVKISDSTSSYGTWTDVTALGGTAYNTLNSYIQTGFNNGWTGVGIISKGNNPAQDTAYNDLSVSGSKGVGIMTIDDYENTIGWGTTYFGVDLSTYASTGVLLRYTYLGDSDFNGKIDSTDVSTVLVGYNYSAPATWVNGSTVYGQEVGGVIDANDVATVLVEYNYPGSSYNPPASAGGISPVPEPSTFVLLLIGVSLLVLRRRFSK